MPSWRSTDDGANSNVNAMLLRLYRAGLTDVTYGDCDAAETKIAKIVSVMTVPLVQGTLKYAYSSGDGKSVGTDGKAFAEMNAFGSSLIARVSRCSPPGAPSTRLVEWRGPSRKISQLCATAAGAPRDGVIFYPPSTSAPQLASANS